MRGRPILLLAVLVAGGALALWRPWEGSAPAGAARTIVLVTIDTQRRDRVGAYAAGGPSLTPRMDGLASRGLRFDDARSPVPLTLAAHAVMLTGLPPAATGIRVNSYGRLPGPAERPYALLAERLLSAGWRTAAFVSAEPLHSHYGLDQGFEIYDDGGEDLDDRSGLYPAERPGLETVSRALGHVRGLGPDERLFLWVHVYEPHAPHAGSYEDDVALADHVVGTLLDGLDSAGRGDAAVLLTADHGEALNDLGEPSHGVLLGDAVLRVPMILAAPGIAPGVREDPADLSDVAPTLAGLAGVPWPAPSGPAGAFRGRDLLAGPAPEGRLRASESLFAHHRFRWAQLVAVVGRDGATFVDAGAGRALRLEYPAPGEPQAPPVLARDVPPEVAEALARYKESQDLGLMRPGAGSTPYGAGGPVAGFLSPEANAKLPNPYEVVARAAVIDQVKARIALLRARPDPRGLRTLREQIVRMLSDDPGNPELWFLKGLAEETAADQGVGDRPIAQTAYLEAWGRDRQDAETLVRAAGVNAVADPLAALKLLDTLGAGIPWDCRCWALEIRLLKALDRPEAVARACEEARRACKSRKDRELLDRECR